VVLPVHCRGSAVFKVAPRQQTIHSYVRPTASLCHTVVATCCVLSAVERWCKAWRALYRPLLHARVGLALAAACSWLLFCPEVLPLVCHPCVLGYVRCAAHAVQHVVH
jgi:hypothetical protein